MAKAIVLVASVLFALVLAASAHKDLTLQGQVYCDPCRVFFLHKLSNFPAGAVVQLKCRNQETGAETYKVNGVTGKDGKYSLAVKGDHEEDICEVTVVSSPDQACNVINDEIDSVKVSLTKNSGIDSPVRLANPIGFVPKKPVPACSSDLLKMGYEWIDGQSPQEDN